MNIGSLKVQNITPLALVDGMVAIKPVADKDFTLTLGVLEYIRNTLVSSNGITFTVFTKTEESADFAEFRNGSLVGQVDGTPFSISPENLDAASDSILSELDKQLAVKFTGDLKLSADSITQKVDDELSISINAVNGNIELVKKVNDLQVGVIFASVYLLPTLIESYSEKCKSFDNGFTVNGGVVVDGLVLSSAIKSSLKEGTLSFTVSSFNFDAEIEKNPERKAFFEKVNANFLETTFDIDFNKISFDSEFSKHVFTQSVKFLLGNSAAIRQQTAKQVALLQKVTQLRKQGSQAQKEEA